MMRSSRWMLGWSLLCACSGPPVGAVRDSGAGRDAMTDGRVEVDAVVADAAETGPVDAPMDRVEADRVDAGMPVDIPIDSPDAVDVGDVDVAAPVDADAAVPVDVPEADVPAVDAGPVVVHYEFVSFAASGEGSGVRFRGVMRWHGSIRGSANGVVFEGSF